MGNLEGTVLMPWIAMHVPVVLHDDARRVSWALGYAPDAESDWVVPLALAASPLVVVAYGLNTMASGRFTALIQGDVAVRNAFLKAVKWEDFGLTEGRAAAVLDGLQANIVLDNSQRAGAAFWDHLEAHGLVKWSDPQEV